MSLLFIIGKILLGGFFVINGVEHFTQIKGTTQYAKHKKIPFPRESVWITGLVLLFGGFSIIFGRMLGLGLFALIVFMTAVTFMTHRFWEEKDPGARYNEKLAFMKNMAICGGLLMLFALVAR